MSNLESGHFEPECGTEQQTEDPEIAEFHKKISTNFDVLPLFERGYYDFVHIRKYSLNSNEKLRSRWHERVISGIDPGSTPMPNINDFHFHNCRTKFLPSASMANYPPPHLRLAPGPGVDELGQQRPIPDDMLDKKPKAEQSTAGKKKKSPKTLRRRSLK